MNDAFAWSQAALNALEALGQPVQPGQQIDSTYSAQLDLLKYMFSEDIVTPPSTVDPTSPYFDIVRSVYTQVNGFNKNGDGSPSPKPADLSADDVIVYCNFKRFKEGEDCYGNPSAGEACDRDVNKEVLMDSDYKGCKANSKGAVMVRDSVFAIIV